MNSIVRAASISMTAAMLGLPAWAQSTSTAKEYSLKDLNEQLVMATLFVQTSAEYRALCLQAYNTARAVLDKDLAEFKTRQKRIVIVDGDETTIQANEYEAALIGKDSEYPEKWFDWVASAKAKPIPGAVEFLKYAASKGVETYYVTNRKIDKEYQGTLDNLKNMGFPYVDTEHVIYRQVGMSDDKRDRQLALEAKFHLVLYVGDNLDDFPANFWEKSVEERFSAADALKDKWGTRFIVLPNPMYGSWERALKNYKRGLSPSEQDAVRKSRLKRWVP